jgi:tRNA-2-methylthio-N6-dimethylallyladenosine synthase
MSAGVSPNTLFVETYGCQMNELDSELVSDQLVALGYRLVDRVEDAGVVLINTCSVRALAEQKVWSRLGRLGMHKRENQPELVIGVLGCMAEREGSAISKRMPHVDLVCGPSHLHLLPTLVTEARRTRQQQLQVAGHAQRSSADSDDAIDGVEALDLSRRINVTGTQAQAYVRVTRGCDKFCSFCVVPYTRGPEVHRPPQHVVDEVQKLTDAGAREVTLIGQTVNHYCYNDGGVTTSFADLLWRVHEAVPSLPRLRFVTSYPRDFGDDILEVMAKAQRIARYLHLPAQSGSNRLLRAMNRGYTIESYLDLIERARARMPELRFAGDMIAGFPSETEDDHRLSISLIERVRYKNLFVFKYSPRPGTVAARRLTDDVPEADKKRRNLELLDAQAKVSLTHNNDRAGEILEVLVESESKLKDTPRAAEVQLGWEKRRATGIRRLVGRTSYDEIVAFEGPPTLVGQIVKVRATAATSLTVLGELIEP